MNRKSALAAAAVTAVLGASGVVAVLAVTGAHVFGLHFGAARPALAAASPTSVETTDVTEAPTTVVPTVPTTAADPIYVVQTEYYDQYVVVPSDGSPPAAPPPPPPPVVQAPAAPGAPAAQGAPASQSPVPGQAPAPAPVVTEATVPASIESQPTETTATTRAPTPSDLVDASSATCGSGCAINVPTEARGFLVPKPAPPSAGGVWTECEFHVGSPPTTTVTNRALPGVWECQK
jgi:hypothetical protein